MNVPDMPLRRYIFRTLGFMSGYIALNMAAIFGLFDPLKGQAAAWLLPLAVSVPIAGQIWATLALMADSDEFVRALTARRFILASGASMALFSAWGFTESYAGAPHAPGWVIYPLFWLAFSIVSPLVRSTR